MTASSMPSEELTLIPLRYWHYSEARQQRYAATARSWQTSDHRFVVQRPQKARRWFITPHNMLDADTFDQMLHLLRMTGIYLIAFKTRREAFEALKLALTGATA